MNAHEFVDRLDRVKPNGAGWMARCPAHDDRTPSLSIREGDEGCVLLHCHAGCLTEQILSALGLKMSDLYPKTNGSRDGRSIVATYDYQDESGDLLYQVVRFHPKDFRQRRPDGHDGWIWNLDKTRRVLYRLPRVLKAIEAGQTIHVCEGEKDVAALERAGEAATCNPMGAGKWRREYAEALHSASDVIVWADCDQAGREHADTIARSLHGHGPTVRVVETYRDRQDGYDVADLISDGQRNGNADDLRGWIASIAEMAPAYTLSLRSRGSDSVDSVRVVLGESGGYGVTESAFTDSVTPDADTPVGSDESCDGVDSDYDSDSVDSDRVFALPVHEFIALEREHREPLLASEDGRAVVGARSLTLVGALGGQGKTTWAMDVFLHMAAGVHYPPWTVVRPVSILMIENEGPEELFADKLEARLEHFPHELKARLDVCTLDWGGFSLADDEHRARLTHEIAEKGYDLVFGDPLDALGIEGVGSPEDTRKFLSLMNQTGLNKKVAWWLNTHPRKEETKDALNEISGAWGGKPDAVFLLRMLEDDRTQLRQPKLRWARRGKGPTLLLAFDPDTEAFTYLGEQSEDERDYLAEVVALLKDGKWRIVKEIAAPVEAGGIAANEKIVKKGLEKHPDIFVSCTGDEAKTLGRSPQATLWQLARNAEGEA